MNDVKDLEGVNFIITGDFNLGFLGSWTHESVSEFINSTSQRMEQSKGVDSRKKQALRLLDLTDSWGLKQMITDGTRKENVLDYRLQQHCFIN